MGVLHLLKGGRCFVFFVALLAFCIVVTLLLGVRVRVRVRASGWSFSSIYGEQVLPLGGEYLELSLNYAHVT